MQTHDGGDTSGVRYKDLNDKTVTVFIEEETSKDDETDHTTEVIGFIVLYGF
jgi:serralysin